MSSPASNRPLPSIVAIRGIVAYHKQNNPVFDGPCQACPRVRFAHVSTRTLAIETVQGRPLCAPICDECYPACLDAFLRAQRLVKAGKGPSTVGRPLDVCLVAQRMALLRALPSIAVTDGWGWINYECMWCSRLIPGANFKSCMEYPVGPNHDPDCPKFIFTFHTECWAAIGQVVRD